MTAVTAEPAAKARPKSAQFLARCEELVYFTEVACLPRAALAAALGCCDKTVKELEKHLAAHPELRQAELAVYGMAGEESRT